MLTFSQGNFSIVGNRWGSEEEGGQWNFRIRNKKWDIFCVVRVGARAWLIWLAVYVGEKWEGVGQWWSGPLCNQHCCIAFIVYLVIQSSRAVGKFGVCGPLSPGQLKTTLQITTLFSIPLALPLQSCPLICPSSLYRPNSDYHLVFSPTCFASSIVSSHALLVSTGQTCFLSHLLCLFNHVLSCPSSLYLLLFWTNHFNNNFCFV